MEHPDENHLAAYIDNTLQKKKRAEVESHLASCENCRSVLGVYGSTISKLKAPLIFPKKTLEPVWVFSIAAVLVVGLALFLVLQLRQPLPSTKTAHVPSQPPIDDSYLIRRGGKKIIDGKTFRLRDGIWIDQDYEAAGKPVATEVRKNTEAFKSLISKKPALKPYAEAGEIVLVLFDNQAYKFIP